MIQLHGTKLSGHTHRVELLLIQLGLAYEFIDSPRPVRRTAEFLRLNPLGQIPVLRDDDQVLADSNAILVYLAARYGKGTGWLPEEPRALAEVQRWLSIAAGEVKHGPGMARLLTLWGGPGNLADAHAIAGGLLRFMEDHLQQRTYLAAARPTLADLACYSYVAHAPEGRISLDPFPNVRAWLGRVEALPGFRPMPRSPLP